MQPERMKVTGAPWSGRKWRAAIATERSLVKEASSVAAAPAVGVRLSSEVCSKGIKHSRSSCPHDWIRCMALTVPLVTELQARPCDSMDAEALVQLSPGQVRNR